MSDLRQYEIHFVFRDETSGVASTKTVLEWAYTVQEACFQFELKRKNQGSFAILEAGPVKKMITNLPNTHFHVCQECGQVVACPCQGCRGPERSDFWEPCLACISKKPHRHTCEICNVEFDCPSNPCWGALHKQGFCGKHPDEEVRAHFKKTMPHELGTQAP